MKSIFINIHTGVDWILRFLAEDIKKSAQKLGIECNVGDFENYNGEEVYFDFLYNSATPMKGAKHNSVFFTHVNLSINEKYILRPLRDKFDSFICMSPEDAEFLIELGFDEKKVFGHTLPVRNNYIKPLAVGIFSSCYRDGVKNEKWLIEYCKTHDCARLANFIFIGRDWDNVVKTLNEYGCSSTWYNITRKLPYEYQYQQNLLSQLDYYIYMGMDGGAMGTYDAYAQCVKLCVTYDGFHKSIPELDLCFDNKEGFFHQLDIILNKQVNRLAFFENNTSDKYIEWLLDVWNGTHDMGGISIEDKHCISFNNVVDKKRSQYYNIKIFTFIKFLKRKIYIFRKSNKYSK